MNKTATEWMIEPLRRYAQFTGRARRAEFWWFFLFGLLVSVVATIVDHLLGTARSSGTGLVGALVSLGLIIPQVAVAVRRLHDIDRTGWWFALPPALAIPIGVLAYLAIATGGGTAVAIGIAAITVFAVAVLLVVWQCTRGTEGANRFGPDPFADTMVY